MNSAALSRAELSTVIALISHLSPQARLRVHQDAIEPWVPGEPFTAGQERPGWIGLLNDDYEPHLTDPRVTAFRYENVRPLHPVRLRRLLNRLETDAFGTVIRSAGFCRFASRPHVVAHWDQVGRTISFDPLSHDDTLEDDQEFLALGQELAIIGLDTGGLTAALDDTALTDGELTAGPTLWTKRRIPVVVATRRLAGE
ncbi:GTP-binding protein [Leifsonia xyli]|uniref:GTP-binding protein n=1 Tax=Leifsonia xyli TaxID=1575 RepID=UPI00159F282D|nr:GTP-binding protein [Leifsonia xyli]